jgi:flagellar biosynthetic protein FliP
MLRQVRDKDLALFEDIAQVEDDATGPNAPLQVLIPAFMISELRRAFEIGFLIYLPFVIIDMVVASILMSMGMMMVPPIIVSLPFKLIFFVLVDGWYLISGSLVKSFGAG